MKTLIICIAAVFIAAFFCILFFHFGGKDNSEKIKAIRKLEIYDIDPFGKKQNISNVVKATIDKATLDKIFDNIDFHKGSRLWKGQFLAIGKLENGNTIELAISYYGGFLTIIGESGYYQLKEKSRELFEKTIKQILSREFIPARKTMSDKDGNGL